MRWAPAHGRPTFLHGASLAWASPKTAAGRQPRVIPRCQQRQGKPGCPTRARNALQKPHRQQSLLWECRQQQARQDLLSSPLEPRIRIRCRDVPRFTRDPRQLGRAAYVLAAKRHTPNTAAALQRHQAISADQRCGNTRWRHKGARSGHGRVRGLLAGLLPLLVGLHGSLPVLQGSRKGRPRLHAVVPGLHPGHLALQVLLDDHLRWVWEGLAEEPERHPHGDVHDGHTVPCDVIRWLRARLRRLLLLHLLKPEDPVTGPIEKVLVGARHHRGALLFVQALAEEATHEVVLRAILTARPEAVPVVRGDDVVLLHAALPHAYAGALPCSVADHVWTRGHDLLDILAHGD